jgi:hypothetical protein
VTLSSHPCLPKLLVEKLSSDLAAESVMSHRKTLETAGVARRNLTDQELSRRLVPASVTSNALNPRDILELSLGPGRWDEQPDCSILHSFETAGDASLGCCPQIEDAREDLEKQMRNHSQHNDRREYSRDQMADGETRAKRVPREFGLYRHGNDNKRPQLAGEEQILELISLGVPLPGIFNRLCAAIDVQIGNVVSILSLPDQDENHSYAITQSAMRMGLNVFWSNGIFSRDGGLLGTIMIYGCDSRQPTPREHKLIERTSHLAAIALQRHEDEQDFGKPSCRTRNGMLGVLHRPPLVIN